MFIGLEVDTLFVTAKPFLIGTKALENAEHATNSSALDVNFILTDVLEVRGSESNEQNSQCRSFFAVDGHHRNSMEENLVHFYVRESNFQNV